MCPFDILYFLAEKRTHFDADNQRRVFCRGDLGGVGIGRGADGFWIVAAAGVEIAKLVRADVIAVGVSERDRVHLAQPWIGSAGNGGASVI